jgi:hypothetical protein
LSWTILLHHDSHVHTFIGGTGTGGSFLVEDHGTVGTFSYEIRLTATDSSGLTDVESVTLPIDTVQPPAGLVAAYSFDAGSGSTVADSSGNNNTGTISGATWTTLGWFGNALSFDGVNDWVTVNDAPSLDLTTGMTLEAWVYPTAGGGWRTAVMKEQSGHLAYALDASSSTNQPRGEVFTTSDFGAVGPAALPLNTWTHLATTYDGATLRLYVNSALVSSTAVSGTIVTSGQPLRIGGNAVWGEYFQGRIDEVRIYNRALSQAEIESDMNTSVSGAPDAPPDTTITANPPALSNSSSASFSFTATKTGSTFSCRLDGSAFVGCSSPQTYNGLIDGSHTFEVRATDQAGNTDSTPASYTWTVDTQPPVISSVSASPGSGGSATITWSTTNEASDSRVDYGTSPSSLTLDVTNAALVTSHSIVLSGLAPNTTYYYRVTSRDAASNPATAPIGDPGSFTTPTVTTVTAFPTSIVIQRGTLRGGGAASLNADDNSYYEVNSTTSGTRVSSWYGVFTGVPNVLSNLKITYKGTNSQSCTQTVSIRRWTTSSWVQLDSRNVGTTEVLITDLVPSGTLADYVSGTGELRVRVRCTRSSPSFFSSGDLMRIDYELP